MVGEVENDFAVGVVVAAAEGGDEDLGSCVSGGLGSGEEGRGTYRFAACGADFFA